MRPLYSVLIPWADRPVLEQTLVANASFFTRHGVEVIVVNAGGDRDALVALIERAAVPNVRAVDLPGVDFSRQLCLNIGALESRSDFLFMLDADIGLRSDVFAQALEHLRTGTRFVAVQRIYESDPGHAIFENRLDLTFLANVITTQEIVTHDGRRAVTCNDIVPGLSNAGDGIVLLTRDAMVRAGGLNSDLLGYGNEDTDFQIRLQLHLGLERVGLGEVVHYTHDASRVDRVSWRRNYRASIENYRCGHYLGTLEQDGTAWNDCLVRLPVVQPSVSA